LGFTATSANGLRATTSASSSPVRTITSTPNPNRSAMRRSAWVATEADLASLDSTTLPLATYVRTSENPALVSSERSSGIGTRL